MSREGARVGLIASSCATVDCWEAVLFVVMRCWPEYSNE